MSGGSWRPDPSPSEETSSRYVKGITSNNWRGPPSIGMTQSPTISKASTYTPGGSTIKFMAAKPAHEFVVGSIACIWNFTEDRNCFDKRGVDRQKEDLLTADIPGVKGLKIYVKTRKIIIIARFINHYLALPVYSHNGRGLESRSEKGEYVSVRDPFGPDVYLPNSTQHGCLYTAATSSDAGWKLMAPKSNVWFTHPMSLSYDKKILFLAKLKPESLSQLCELYMTATKDALLNTLHSLNPPLWSNAPNSLGSEQWKRLADKPESEKQKSEANNTQLKDQTYSGAVMGQTILGPTITQISGNTTGFQILKRPQASGPLDEISANPAKRVKQ